jgi:DNA-binding MarR family transcriptional regulator
MEERNLCFELVTLGHLLKRERDRCNEIIKDRVLGEGNNLMCSDLSIICFLAKNHHREVYQKDIEHHFSLTAPSVSNKLRDLESKGLIHRKYSTIDTRLKHVIMTDKAKDIAQLIQVEMTKFEKRIANLLTEEEIDSLFTILDKIKEDFES